MLGGLKDLEGSGLSLKQSLESSFPASSEDPDAESMSTELKELLSRLVVLMAQTEKLNKATKVNESVDEGKRTGTSSSSQHLSITSPSPHSCVNDEENGRRSPEGSAAGSTPTTNSIVKSPSGTSFLEVAPGANREGQISGNQNWFGGNGNQGNGGEGEQGGKYLPFQCGCCGAPILISVLTPEGSQQQQHHQLFREHFYRIPQATTNAKHHLQQDGVFH